MSALLVPADFGRGFRRIPHAQPVWRSEWSDRTVSWKCHDALGRMAQAPGVSASAVTLVESEDEFAANEIVSFDSVPAAGSALSSLRESMTACTRDRGVELTGSEGVTELRLTSDYAGGTSGERIDVHAEGKFYEMGGSYAVAWDATVARSANHLTLVYCYPLRGTPSRADRVAELLEHSLDRLAEVSNGRTPPGL